MQGTDEDLLAAIRGGDGVALERLLERHAARVMRFAGKMCRDPDDAKDVVQETLIAAARNLPEFRGGSSVSTWLYTVARSFCIKKRRRSKHAPEHMLSIDDEPDAHAVASTEPAPEEAVAARELGDALSRAIATLDPVSREVVVLRDVEGLTAPEVASIVGLSVEAVKSRLHRARVSLRELLEPHVRDLPAPLPGCPDVVGMYSRHVESEITAADCEAMEQHLASCPACTAACDSLKRTLALCRAAPAGEVSLEVQSMVREALRQLDSRSA